MTRDMNSARRFIFRPAISILVRAMLLSLPVVALYAIQFVHQGPGWSFSGFIYSDMPVYMANARQYLESPGSLLYSNPYDFNGPRIYFQPLIWLLGQLLRLGVDPAALFAVVGFAVTFAAMIVLQRLLRDYQPLSRSMADWVLVLAAWGGGLLMIGHLLTGRSLDPERGFWLLNFGRNFIFPTEAFYHLLTLLLFWTVLRRRYWLSLTLALALAISHPFTGAQYAAIVLIWAAVERIADRRAMPLVRLGAFALPLVFVAGYYLIYLPSHPSHAVLVHQWGSDRVLQWSTALAAYAPVAFLAGHRLWTDPNTIGSFERFLIVAALISFGLTKHDLLISPVQPLHFARGHIWFPLFLLGLPSLIKLVRDWARRRPRRLYVRLVVAISFLFLYDNFTFLAYHMLTPTGVFISRDNRELIEYVKHRDDAPIVMSNQIMAGYLLATYTGARPFVSHPDNTPSYQARLEQARHFFEEGVLPPDLAQECVLVAVREDEQLPALKSGGWSFTNLDDWQIAETTDTCRPDVASVHWQRRTSHVFLAGR